MTVRIKVQYICLSQLVPSATNVRKTLATAADDAVLEASIRARGILQNLVVHSTPIDSKGVYEVDAGGAATRSCRNSPSKASSTAINPM